MDPRRPAIATDVAPSQLVMVGQDVVMSSCPLALLPDFDGAADTAFGLELCAFSSGP